MDDPEKFERFLRKVEDHLLNLVSDWSEEEEKEEPYRVGYQKGYWDATQFLLEWGEEVEDGWYDEED